MLWAHVLPLTAGSRLQAPGSESGLKAQAVLFLCTGNSCRSQMAEGFLRHLAGGRFEAASAGSDPVPVNPMAIAVMAEDGIDISGQRSKSVDEFVARDLAWLITVCDRAARKCPTFPGTVQRLAWDLPDPAHVTGSEEVRLAAFRDVRDTIRTLVEKFGSDPTGHRPSMTLVR